MRQIPYGEGNFEKIRTNNNIYIDKTMYIEKLEQGPDRSKTIYLRPRRFGKSLFTSMLECYYSVDMANKFEELFKGLYIYDHPTENKNNYYVLKFNFSGLTIIGENVVQEGVNAFYASVKDSISQFISRYKLPIEIKGDMASDLLRNLLVKFQELNLEHKIYIVIDEYDNFTNAILKGDAKDFLDLVNRNGYVRAFYEIIKMKLEEGVVDRFFATGVMPVTLDNLTSGFNIATNLSTHPFFTSMIGFSHEEVNQLVEEVIPQEKQKEVYESLEKNYDGYKFSEDSEEKVFNSTLVLYYLKNYMELNKPPKELLDMNMNLNGEKVKRIAELVKKEDNYKTIEEIILKDKISGKLKGVVFNEEYERNDLLTMMFYLGYLTIEDADVETIFTIPNYITRTVFADYFAKVLSENETYKIDTANISEAITVLARTGDIMPVVDIVKEFLSHQSTRDLENFSEKTLKYVFTMFLELSTQYIVYGEFPANQGFADILVEKSSSSNAKYEAIIELKYNSKKNGKKASKKKLLQEAREQLEYYMADKRLEQRENLKKYMIVFNGFEDVIVEELYS